jgi:site-specific recombinase XerD
LVFDTWLRAHRSHRTRDAYHTDITNLFDFTGNKALQELTLLDLLDFEVHLTQEGKRPTTIARKLSAVKSLLTFCYKAGYSGERWRSAEAACCRDTLGHASIATTNKYSHARPGESSGTFLAI